MPLRESASTDKPAVSRNPSLASTRSLSSRVLAWGRRSTTTTTTTTAVTARTIKKASTASTATTDENVVRSSSLVGEEYSYYYQHKKTSLRHHATRKSSNNTTSLVAFTKEEQRKIRMVASPGEHFDENGDLVAPAQHSTPRNRIFSLRPSQQQPLMDIMYGSPDEDGGFAFENPSSFSTDPLLFGMCFFTESATREESEDC